MKTEPQSDLSLEFKFLPANKTSQNPQGLPTENTDSLSQSHSKGRISLGAMKQDGNWALDTQAGKINPRVDGGAWQTWGEADQEKS